jgi:FkbM family methyltransferase
VLNDLRHSAGQARRKIPWGVKQVGLARTAAGMVQLARLGLRRPDTAQVTTRRDGLSISFRYPSQLMPTLVLYGDLLEPELGLLPLLLGPGAVAVDVGASIGTWTMTAARLGATVHACEPDPANLQMLTENLAANGLTSQVTTHCVAVGAHEGAGALVSAKRRYRNRVVDASDDQGTSCRLMKLTRFADELGISEIDVLKVNTAGSEDQVVTGAASLFHDRRIKLAMFLDGLAVRPLLDELCGDAYQLGVFSSADRRFIPASNSTRLDGMKSSPMDHYALVCRKDVSDSFPANR